MFNCNFLSKLKHKTPVSLTYLKHAIVPHHKLHESYQLHELYCKKIV